MIDKNLNYKMFIPIVFDIFIIFFGIYLPYKITYFKTGLCDLFKHIDDFNTNIDREDMIAKINDFCYYDSIRVRYFYLFTMIFSYIINQKFYIKPAKWVFSSILFYLIIILSYMLSSEPSYCFEPFDLVEINGYLGSRIPVQVFTIFFTLKVLIIQCLTYFVSVGLKKAFCFIKHRARK